jgi:hypothetical protein
MIELGIKIINIIDSKKCDINFALIECSEDIIKEIKDLLQFYVPEDECSFVLANSK